MIAAQAYKKRSSRPPRCVLTRHVPVTGTAAQVDGVTRARCRYCGSNIFKMAHSIRWMLSGELGG